MFCLALLISITLVACGSDDNKNNEDVNNNDNANTNTEEQVDTNADENENNTDSNADESEDLDTGSENNADSASYDIDPNGENIIVLETVQNGVTMKITYKADGDKVIEQTADNILPYESIGVATAEEAEEILAEIAAAYQSTEGVVHSMDYQDDKVIESLTINYENADMNEVSELTGTVFEGDISQGISLKRSVDMLLEQGFEIVE